MLAEGAWRGPRLGRSSLAGAAIFAAAKALKWWAILSLGPFWTFRVIVVPGSRRDHQRTLSVRPTSELRRGRRQSSSAVAMMTGAVVSGPLALLVFAALLVKRIAVEERALHGGDPLSDSGV